MKKKTVKFTEDTVKIRPSKNSSSARLCSWELLELDGKSHHNHHHHHRLSKKCHIYRQKTKSQKLWTRSTFRRFHMLVNKRHRRANGNRTRDILTKRRQQINDGFDRNTTLFIPTKKKKARNKNNNRCVPSTKPNPYYHTRSCHKSNPNACAEERSRSTTQDTLRKKR